MATVASKAIHSNGTDKMLISTADRVGEQVKSYAHSAADATVQGVDTMVDKSVATVKKAAKAVPEVENWAETRLEATREAVRAEPIKSLAIAAGVGALAGLLLLRR